MTTSNPSSTTWSLEPTRRRWISGVLATFWLSGLGLLRGKRGILLVLLSAVPSIPVVVSRVMDDARLLGSLGFVETVPSSYFLLMLVTLFLGCAAVGEERDNGTLPYLLVRPVPRSAIACGRFLSAAFNSLLVVTPFLVVDYFLCVQPMGDSALRQGLPILAAVWRGAALAVLAYSAVFTLIGILFKRPLWVGLILAIAWEKWVSVTKLPLADYSVLHHVYVRLTHETLLERFLELSSMDADHVQSPARSLVVLVGIAAVSMVLAGWTFSRKEYSA